jgi:DNA primase
MSTLYPSIKSIKESVTIEQVIDELRVIDLNHNGYYLQGLCPTGHKSENEKCFTVFLETDSYYCFNCGISGDIFDLVELIKGFSFIEAKKWIIKHFQSYL